MQVNFTRKVPISLPSLHTQAFLFTVHSFACCDEWNASPKQQPNGTKTFFVLFSKQLLVHVGNSRERKQVNKRARALQVPRCGGTPCKQIGWDLPSSCRQTGLTSL